MQRRYYNGLNIFVYGSQNNQNVSRLFVAMSLLVR